MSKNLSSRFELRFLLIPFSRGSDAPLIPWRLGLGALLSHMHNRKRKREICVAPEITVMHVPTTACKMRAVVYADVYNKKLTERKSGKDQMYMTKNQQRESQEKTSAPSVELSCCVRVCVCVSVCVCLFLSLFSPLPRRDIGFDPSKRQRHTQEKDVFGSKHV